MLGPLILALVLLTSITNSIPVSSNDTLQWRECPEEAFPDAKRIQCAYLGVPLDHEDKQNSATIKIGVARLPARDPKRRIGNLFHNPGGPGEQASAIAYGIDTGDPNYAVDQEILDRFDWIGIDSRGAGLSEHLICDLNLYNTALPMYPNNAEEFDQVISRNQAFRQSCIDITGRPLFDYMDTRSIAQDYEAVRKALGDEPLTWLGQSWGTYLGSIYAELFPNGIRGMILDGAVLAGEPETAMFIEGAASVEGSFRYFLEWCEKQDSTVCPLAHQDRAATTIWTQFLKRADESPIPMAICQTGTCNYSLMSAFEFLSSTLTYLDKGEPGFPSLASLIYNADVHNDVTEFATVGTSMRDPYSLFSLSVNTATVCQDFAHNATSYVDTQYRGYIEESEMPLMRGICPSYFFFRNCVGLPPPTRNPPHVIDIPRSSTLPTILIVENVYDPATPLAWAVDLRQQIGEERAVLAVRHAAGHTTYFRPSARGGEAVKAMNDYLLDLKVPEQGTVFQS